MKETFRVDEEGVSGVAKKVLDTLLRIRKDEAKLIFLEGDLGAGKTTFTKEIAHHLGIDKEEVHSPTFILKKEYVTAHNEIQKLIHIDAYRFENHAEGKVLRVEDDLLDPNNLIIIEWPEKMKSGNPDMTIRLSVVDDETRDLLVDM